MSTMTRDTEALAFAKENGYKYVAARPDGTIAGFGLTRQCLAHQTIYTVYTIRQYEQATEGGGQ